MNNPRLTIFPASNGDAILLTIDGFTLLVDSGYAETYTTYIKPVMEGLSSKSQQLSLFVITHIDADHISGAIRFLDENLSKPIVGINHIWHNSYRHLSKFAKTTTIDSLPEGLPIHCLPSQS
jgi:glyoxylase-like metal-dependent hydrolase (beta-lactamase superfamily II)